VRNTAVSTWVKQQHDHCCQFCGERLETPAGGYSEGAHIRPLGRPHDGPDSADNLLCLCPNHHVLFDAGALYVSEDGSVCSALDGSTISRLRTTKQHAVSTAQLEYHRDHLVRRVT
jgi:putative restriction endonuclease